MHCIHITNAVNTLVMCNEEIYCPHVYRLFRSIPSILTSHYYLKRSFFTFDLHIRYIIILDTHLFVLNNVNK